MDRQYKVAVLVGSLRKASYNRKMAQAAAKLAPASLILNVVEIGSLPLYNEDLEGANAPTAWTAFRQTVKESEALLFVTPEYNRSVPAGLKNALDVGSRPHGQNVFGGKPAAIVSVSPGAMGAFGANHHLRQSLVALGVSAISLPEAYIGGAAKLFDEAGNLANDSTKEFLQKFMQAFTVWVGKHAPA